VRQRNSHIPRRSTYECNPCYPFLCIANRFHRCTAVLAGLRSSINLSDIPVVVVVVWHPASNGAATELSTDGLSLGLDGSDLFDHGWRAGVVIELEDQAAAAGIVPGADGSGFYSIVQSGSRRVAFTFAGFAHEPGLRLDANSPVRTIVARDLFDQPGATLTADWLTVALA
jgi:hypothetical protein